MFRVLKPSYEKTGEAVMTPQGPMYWQRVTWIVLGTASDMAEARSKYGGRPVLERITN